MTQNQPKISYIKIKVKPKAGRRELIALQEETGFKYKADLQSSPDNGKANSELIDLLSDHFNISKSSIKIVSGKSARTKLIKISPEN